MGGALVGALVASAEERGIEDHGRVRRRATCAGTTDGWTLDGGAAGPVIARARSCSPPAVSSGTRGCRRRSCPTRSPRSAPRATPATGWSSAWPRAAAVTTMRAVWGVPVLQDPGARLRRSPVGPDGERRADPARVDHGERARAAVRQRGRQLPRPQQGVPHDRLRTPASCANIPAWMVVDSRLRGAVLRSAARRSAQRPAVGATTRRHRSTSSPRRCGIDPDGLAATVAEFNRHAARGPRPALPPRRRARRTATSATPRRAAPLPGAARAGAVPRRSRSGPGTLGTCGGLVTDDDGRCSTGSAAPIAGLYAAGQRLGHRVRRRLPGRRCDAGLGHHPGYAVGRAIAAFHDKHERGRHGDSSPSSTATADDAAALDEHRPSHRDYLRTLFEAGVTRRERSAGRGRRSRAHCSMLRADSADAVRGQLDGDPFHRLGLIVEREVRAWSPAFGGERLSPASG